MPKTARFTLPFECVSMSPAQCIGLVPVKKSNFFGTANLEAITNAYILKGYVPHGSIFDVVVPAPPGKPPHKCIIASFVSASFMGDGDDVDDEEETEEEEQKPQDLGEPDAVFDKEEPVDKSDSEE